MRIFVGLLVLGAEAGGHGKVEPRTSFSDTAQTGSTITGSQQPKVRQLQDTTVGPALPTPMPLGISSDGDGSSSATISSVDATTTAVSTESIVEDTFKALNWTDIPELPTYTQFCAAVDAYNLTKAGGHPPVPSQELYYHYQDIVARNMTLKEQAMLLANVVWESGGLQFVEEIACRHGNCTYGKYFGRGFIQLTWDYNYRDASHAIYGDDRLLEHPELVARVVDAWRTTLWYWRSHVTPRLHENDAIDNSYLGYAVMAINGQLECKPKTNAKERLRVYNGILAAWGLDEGGKGDKMKGCLEKKREKQTEKEECLEEGEKQAEKEKCLEKGEKQAEKEKCPEKREKQAEKEQCPEKREKLTEKVTIKGSRSAESSETFVPLATTLANHDRKVLATAPLRTTGPTLLSRGIDYVAAAVEMVAPTVTSENALSKTPATPTTTTT